MPTEGDYSSAAAELRMAVLVSKFIVATRAVHQDRNIGSFYHLA